MLYLTEHIKAQTNIYQRPKDSYQATVQDPDKTGNSHFYQIAFD